MGYSKVRFLYYIIFIIYIYINIIYIAMVSSILSKLQFTFFYTNGQNARTFTCFFMDFAMDFTILEVDIST